MEGSVGGVGEVWVEEEGWMSGEDPGDEGGVGEVDCAAETDGEVDHLFFSI